MLSLYKKAISPMLAQLGSKRDLQLKGFFYEPKLDGTRCILYKTGNRVRMLNRRGNYFEHRFPEIAAEAKKLDGKFILDGEVIVLDENGLPNFSKLQSRDQTENRLRIRLLAKDLPATLYVFDILACKNASLTSLKLTDRKYVLDNKLPDNMTSIKNIFYVESGKKLWRNVRKFNIEGVVAKDKNSRYLIGVRSKSWLKIKNTKSADCIICGYTLGKREHFASLVLGQYHKGDLIHVGQVGTGFSEEQLRGIANLLRKIPAKRAPFKSVPDLEREVRWVKPKHVAEVKFLSYTKRLHLRAPSFKRLRFDKPLKECIVEN